MRLAGQMPNQEQETFREIDAALNDGDLDQAKKQRG